MTCTMKKIHYICSVNKKAKDMINRKFEILILRNLVMALNYAVDNLCSLETLRVRNIMIILTNELRTAIETLIENDQKDTEKRK